MALCRDCSTPIPCHCHIAPAAEARPGIYRAPLPHHREARTATMKFWRKTRKAKSSTESRQVDQREVLLDSLRSAHPALAVEVDHIEERRAAHSALHAHEITPADAAIIRMMSGSRWGDDATMILPSGKAITGREMRLWVQTASEE